MSALHQVKLDARVVVGSARLRIREVLKLSRGAVVPLDAAEQGLSELQVNGRPVALGKIVVDGERVALEVVRMTGAAR